MQSPCKKDCPDRSTTCHIKGNCQHGYDEYAEYREQIRQARAKFQITAGYLAESVSKNHRKDERK